MKKAIFFFYAVVFAAFIYSCADDDNYQQVNYVAVPVDSVSMPDSARINAGQILIKTYVTAKQNCENFYGFGYEREDTTRYVAPWLVHAVGVECGEDVVMEPEFNFQPQVIGTYVFKFWTGVDESEQNTFMERQIVITSE